MPRPLLILSQSDYLIRIVNISSHTYWQTEQIQISWLLKKPTDLDLHCLKRRAYPGSAGQGLTLTMLVGNFRVDWSWNIFYGHSLPWADSRSALSVSGKSMRTILVNHLEDCPVKVWLSKLTELDMTPLGWLGHKTSTQTLLMLLANSAYDNVMIFFLENRIWHFMLIVC